MSGLHPLSRRKLIKTAGLCLLALGSGRLAAKFAVPRSVKGDSLYPPPHIPLPTPANIALANRLQEDSIGSFDSN